MSRISVIIPAFNRAELLPLTLQSLLEQTLPAYEIIVVDDGSTDHTAEVAANFSSTIRVIRQQNAGPAAARNRGFNESTGDLIHFFDSDDIALANKHEVQAKALEDSGGDIAYCPWVKGKIGSRSFIAENHVLQQRGLPDDDLTRALLTGWSIVPHAALFRRTIVEKAGGFPEELVGTEDQLMFLRCLLGGASVVHTPDTLELYRTGDTSKLTENPDAKSSQLAAWARFLLLARNDCLEKDIDPIDWFGYRQRVWEVIQDLEETKATDTELLAELSALPLASPRWRYPAKRWFDRKRGGIRQRLGSGRSAPCFKGAPLTQKQLGLIRSWEDNA